MTIACTYFGKICYNQFKFVAFAAICYAASDWDCFPKVYMISILDPNRAAKLWTPSFHVLCPCYSEKGLLD